jgi:hypothetical protein
MWENNRQKHYTIENHEWQGGGADEVFWNRRLFGQHRPLNRSMIVTSDLLRQARKAWRALGRFLFYFIEELEWKKLWCVSKTSLNPMSSMQCPKIVIYPNKYLFSGLTFECQNNYFIFQNSIFGN